MSPQSAFSEDSCRQVARTSGRWKRGAGQFISEGLSSGSLPQTRSQANGFSKGAHAIARFHALGSEPEIRAESIINRRTNVVIELVWP